MVKLSGRNESSPGVMSAGCLVRTPGSPGMQFLFEDTWDAETLLLMPQVRTGICVKARTEEHGKIDFRA